MDDSHKKIYRSMDDSYNGLLNCDVPFVFVRPLRESSLPFFERSCRFLELDVGVSNCVEVFFIFYFLFFMRTHMLERRIRKIMWEIKMLTSNVILLIFIMNENR